MAQTQIYTFVSDEERLAPQLMELTARWSPDQIDIATKVAYEWSEIPYRGAPTQLAPCAIRRGDNWEFCIKSDADVYKDNPDEVRLLYILLGY